MKVDAAKGDYGWRVFDLLTGRELDKVISADDEAGLAEVYVTDAAGNIAHEGDWALRRLHKGPILLLPPSQGRPAPDPTLLHCEACGKFFDAGGPSADLIRCSWCNAIWLMPEAGELLDRVKPDAIVEG